MELDFSEIEQEGRIAYLCGFTLIDGNPYRRAKQWEAADAWENGWMEARQEAEGRDMAYGEEDDEEEPSCRCGKDIWWRCPCPKAA